MGGATGWGIALDALGNLGEGISGVIGSNEAANQETNAIDTARSTYTGYYNQAKQFQQPYYQAGTEQLQNLNNGINNGAFTDKEQFNFQQSPEYQFQQQQGNQNIQQQAAAGGSMFSGATMKALAKYGSNLAAQQYQQSYNNFLNNRQFNQTNLNNQYNRMQTVANNGQNAGQSLANLTSGMGNEMAGLDIARGNVNASRDIANAQATQGVFKSIADLGAGMAGNTMANGQGGSGSSAGGYNGMFGGMQAGGAQQFSGYGNNAAGFGGFEGTQG